MSNQPKSSPPEPAQVQEPHRSPGEERKRERKRRRNEFIFAACAFLLVLILTSLQLDKFRTGDSLFMIMFNINVVLLLAILIVVLRNGIKLLLERRRKVLGSKLRTRLVLAFFAMSLLPCSLMFLVTTKYVQLSMDFWFKDQVETSMETALDVAKVVYEKTGLRLVSQSEHALSEILERRLVWSGQGMDNVLLKKKKEYRLVLVGLLAPDGVEKNWHADQDSIFSWKNTKEKIDWTTLRNQGSLYMLTPGVQSDYVFSLLAVDGGKSGFLVFGEDVGAGFKARLDRIAKGAGEYKNLRRIKQPLKLMLYSSLGVMTILIILGAIWFGFRVAREISAPVLAMAAGTARIAKGDLTVRLDDSSTDELGMLIRSFNSMAEDLEYSQRKITGTNALLEKQNKRIERHSKYIEAVLNNIAAGVISFDQNGRINTANKAACDILRIDLDRLESSRIENIFPSPNDQIARDIKERLQKRLDSRVQHSLTLMVNEEERRLLINIVGFSTEGVYGGAVAVFEDISELERMQRMAAWREVARRIAHEIKNPLTPIKLSAQRLARKFGKQIEDSAFLQSTDVIVRQVEHLQNMVQEFSAFAKLPEVNPVQGSLALLLEQITSLFRNSHSTIAWQLDIENDLPLIPIDKEALHRAFMNIYTNAVEVLEQSCTLEPFVCIIVRYSTHLQMVHIDITDNGPGLTEEERARVFEPYFSHKKGGTGLGLTIVRSIIADHRGYVRALPREGGGTIISMELPLA